MRTRIGSQPTRAARSDGRLISSILRTKGESLRGSYWPTVVVTLLALSPDFALSTALGQVGPVIAGDLGSQQATVSWGSNMSTAALAFGAVVAADLAQRFRNRPLFLSYEAMFVVGSLAAALAPATWVYAVGHALQGLATGMLLVAVLPPLVTAFPVHRLKTTIPAVVIGLFGATTAGPVIGGLTAQIGAWRALFWATVVMGVTALVLAFAALAERPALNPGMRLDVPALALSVVGALSLFSGVGALMSYSWDSPLVYAPLAAGALMLAALVVVELRGREPLMPARRLGSTFPVMGILAALISGAAFTGLVQLRIVFYSRCTVSIP